MGIYHTSFLCITLINMVTDFTNLGLYLLYYVTYTNQVFLVRRNQFKTITCSKCHQEISQIAIFIKSKARNFFPISKYIVYIFSHSGHMKNACNCHMRFQKYQIRSWNLSDTSKNDCVTLREQGIYQFWNIIICSNIIYIKSVLKTLDTCQTFG